MRENFDSLLADALREWKWKIEKYPDRFMWETDRGSPVKVAVGVAEGGWTFDEEVGRVIVEFARTFIARLAPSVQENFAHKNASRILKTK
ncbi:MAG: Uncharacterized protein G01um101472_501 [Parcubacteria group bacterium Gr01-1014_72]|nr:MAG: Uncharacterized protein G01um101472_501 [Parcubacteria group bacterium Gr01-1014_72]